ncbi:radical SAM family heme chaperone HemW [candidate division FCPU426 bacterium]|nr:radical SAM family heme chaperone HemW [candidate division FCPU426 bacterium]
MTDKEPHKGKGVYIHIPFCLKKCAYCDFASQQLHSHEEVNQYLEALLSEISIRAQGQAYTVYFGGGTPSILPSGQVAVVLQAIRRHMEIKPLIEISMEVNPATVDDSDLVQLKETGINRLSLGLQSTSDFFLNRLGRIHSAQDCKQVFYWARQAGFNNISCDLIYGIPGQTLKDLKEDLQQLVRWSPEHLSMYALHLEPNTPLARLVAQHALPEPDDDTTADMYAWIREFLPTQGYKQYELSNFSKPGYACQHNMMYWQNQEYLGFGSAAHSYSQGVRSWNVQDKEEYVRKIGRKKNATEGREKLGGIRKISEHLMLELRLTRGVKKRQFKDIYGDDWNRNFSQAIEKMKSRGFLAEDRATLKLTPRGMFVSNMVFRELL